MRLTFSIVFSSLVLSAAVAACSSSSAPSGSSASLTCRGGTGPESTACDDCGASSCASDHAAVTSDCATMVSCIEACECDANDTCLDGCISAASSNCQTLINTYADCEKQASACSSACSS